MNIGLLQLNLHDLPVNIQRSPVYSKGHVQLWNSLQNPPFRQDGLQTAVSVSTNKKRYIESIQYNNIIDVSRILKQSERLTRC